MSQVAGMLARVEARKREIVMNPQQVFTQFVAQLKQREQDMASNMTPFGTISAPQMSLNSVDYNPFGGGAFGQGQSIALGQGSAFGGQSQAFTSQSSTFGNNDDAGSIMGIAVEHSAFAPIEMTDEPSQVDSVWLEREFVFGKIPTSEPPPSVR